MQLKSRPHLYNQPASLFRPQHSRELFDWHFFGVFPDSDVPKTKTELNTTVWLLPARPAYFLQLEGFCPSLRGNIMSCLNRNQIHVTTQRTRESVVLTLLDIHLRYILDVSSVFSMNSTLISIVCVWVGFIDYHVDSLCCPMTRTVWG